MKRLVPLVLVFVFGNASAEVIPYSWGQMVSEKTVEPLLRIRNVRGQDLKVYDLKAVRDLSHQEDYALLNPFVLRFACFEGDAHRVSEEILLDRNFLDHFGDYACPIEAEVRDGRRIEYSCVQSDSHQGARTFTIKSCPSSSKGPQESSEGIR